MYMYQTKFVLLLVGQLDSCPLLLFVMLSFIVDYKLERGTRV